MERGEMRVDANISVRELGDNRLGTRTEIKNLNSLRSVSRAVEYEVWRQINLIEDGEIVENETRGFDFAARSTHSMRDKERKQDYRFMPEPNLPPLRLRAEQVEGERANLPELPQQTRLRIQEYGVSEEVSFQLVDKPELLNLFNSCVEFSPKNYKSLASIILLVVQEYLSFNSVNLTSTPLDPESLVTAVNLKESRTINYSALRELVRLLLDGDKRRPELIIDENGWRLITDKTIINKFVEECMVEHSDIVNKYCSAKEKKKKNVWTNLLIQVNKDDRTEKLDMSIMSQLLLQALEKQRNIIQENKLKSP
ncbi:uncharacterized protein LOC111709998 [Eurytemora carolleeae]|uniref:uncharacterized protein LOC111709998 n=1 Tax=Eurytemora carolleeae TaxID=1294199 RepID=UPI000C7934D6|nr:uncharacterized protein LOC111709998 [Eurytemora carolleeae]|eukprot:XP_023339754.1 uncharacterized protein LOC111709998 [Eurytemora affinis]